MLSSLGFHYPNTGIPKMNGLCGHHNLAWQLTKDRRFNPAWGNLNALLQEIKHVNGQVILSSENFESSLLHPSNWTWFLSELKSLGFEIIFVIYLRDPLSYLESLYLDLIRFGLREEYQQIANIVLKRRQLNINQWEFCFDYEKIQESVLSIQDLTLIFRNYDSLVGNSTIIDFCELVGIDSTLLSLPINSTKINQRLPLNDLLRLFIKNKFGDFNDETSEVINDVLNIDHLKPTSPMAIRDGFNRAFTSHIDKMVNHNEKKAYTSITISGNLILEDSYQFLDMNKVFSLNAYQTIQRLIIMKKNAPDSKLDYLLELELLRKDLMDLMPL